MKKRKTSYNAQYVFTLSSIKIKNWKTCQIRETTSMLTNNLIISKPQKKVTIKATVLEKDLQWKYNLKRKWNCRKKTQGKKVLLGIRKMHKQLYFYQKRYFKINELWISVSDCYQLAVYDNEGAPQKD